MNRHSRIQCYITLTFPTFSLLFVSTTTRRGRLLFRARPRARYSLPSFLALSFRLCSSTKTYAKPATLAFDASNVTRTSRKRMRAITKNVFFFQSKMHYLFAYSGRPQWKLSVLSSVSPHRASNWPSQRNWFSRKYTFGPPLVSLQDLVTIHPTFTATFRVAVTTLVHSVVTFCPFANSSCLFARFLFLL